MKKKFDVVIGNPPYQEEAGGTATHGKPIYHRFMDAAYEVGKKAVLITPARFLFNAGYTPKAWNSKMLADPHLTVEHYVPKSDQLFPGTDIKGGVTVTYRDEARQTDPIGTFTSYPELNTVVQKVIKSDFVSIAADITSSRSYRYTAEMHDAYPAAASTMPKGEQFKINTKTFQHLSFLYREARPENQSEYSRVLGLIGRARAYRWIRSEYLSGPKNFRSFKVVVPKANGSGVLGEALSSPVVVGPQVAVTQTFVTIGCFNAEATADACLKYVKSKFARALLGVLKITQDNPARVWQYIPLQDFTAESDIDWTQPISGIDQQLYAKYDLDADEMAFIESNIKAME